MLYKKKKWMAWIFVLPFLAFAGFFLIYPFIQNIINMFLRYVDEWDTAPAFVGGDNFTQLWNTPYFGVSVANTFILIACVIAFQMGIALILALLVNNIKRGAQIFRVLFFVPIVLSGAAIGLMFTIFQDRYNGLFNTILKWFGIEHGSWIPMGNAWSKEHMAALFYVMVPVVWQYIGFYFVILLTGLTNISDDILEAAQLDGASGFKQTFYIHLPMLQNVFRTCMVLAITGALKVYDIPVVLASSNPNVYFMGTFNQMLYTRMNFSEGFGGYTMIGECSIYSTMIVVIGILVSQISNFVLKENKDI